MDQCALRETRERESSSYIILGAAPIKTNSGGNFLWVSPQGLDRLFSHEKKNKKKKEEIEINEIKEYQASARLVEDYSIDFDLTTLSFSLDIYLYIAKHTGRYCCFNNSLPGHVDTHTHSPGLEWNAACAIGLRYRFESVGIGGGGVAIAYRNPTILYVCVYAIL
jgi:hypothetical protein